MRLGRKEGEPLRCSFCHKSKDVVGKLISSPSDYPRAYICDECIAVCSSILEDDKPHAADEVTTRGGGDLPDREANVPAKLRAACEMLDQLAPDELDAVCHLLEVLLKQRPRSTARSSAP